MSALILKIFLLLLFLSNTYCSDTSLSLVKGDIIPPTTVTPPTVPPVQKKKLDLLIIIDNSLSMLPEHQLIGQKLKGFSQHLEGIDYQIAVTTTDAREVQISQILYSKAWAQLILSLASNYISPVLTLVAQFILSNSTAVDFSDSLNDKKPIVKTPQGFGGKVLSFNGKNFISPNTLNGENLILSSLDRSRDANCDSSDIDDDTDYWEEEEEEEEEEIPQTEMCSTGSGEPIKVIKQVLQQKHTANTGFLRQDAHLVALIITDEDIEVFEHKDMDMAQELNSITSMKNKFKAYGIITQEGDVSNCQANWSGDTSKKIQEFIGLSGGFHSSICDNNYTAIFDKIAADFK